MPMIVAPICHELKVWPLFFDALANGTKPFEIRQCGPDRIFDVGHELHLREWAPHILQYTGREIRRRVTFVLCGEELGLRSGYCVLGLAQPLPTAAAMAADPEEIYHAGAQACAQALMQIAAVTLAAPAEQVHLAWAGFLSAAGGAAEASMGYRAACETMQASALAMTQRKPVEPETKH